MVRPVSAKTTSCCCVSSGILLLALCATVALAVIFRQQVTPYAKKFAALYVKGPLYVQLPLVGASAMIATFVLLYTSGRLYRCCFPGPHHSLTDPETYTKLPNK